MDMEKKGIPGDSIRKVYASAKEWYGNILKIKSDYVRQNPVSYTHLDVYKRHHQYRVGIHDCVETHRFHSEERLSLIHISLSVG